MKSSNTTKNPIHFDSKKQELENLHKKEGYLKKKMRFGKASDNSHKILEYPTKRKKSVKKLISFKDYLKGKFKKLGKLGKIVLYILIIVGFIVAIDKLLISRGSSTGASTKIASQNTYIPASKQSTYSKIIDQTVKKYTSTTYKIKTNTMHKNGNKVYATGYINDLSEGKIYFDLILQNNNPSSLVINGDEYIK